MTTPTSNQLQASLATVSQDVSAYLKDLGLMPEALHRIKECLETTTEGGNKLRGRAVLDSGLVLAGPDISTSQIEDLLVLGSLVEIFNAAYLVWDDIMDGSETRRGKPCWYRNNNVGLVAINDACLLKSVISVVLLKRFGNHPAYRNLVDLFSEASLRTELGQHCDLLASERILELGQFTWDKYEFITANKTGYYTFYLPIMIPLIYLGQATKKRADTLYDLAVLMGLIFQGRDDFLDVYGDPEITGKVGTDIEENKCSWLLVETLERCDMGQRAVLEKCYGSREQTDIHEVRNVFEQLSMPEVFVDWDRSMLEKLEMAIEAADNPDNGGDGGTLKRELFQGFLAKYFADPRRSITSAKCKF